MTSLWNRGLMQLRHSSCYVLPCAPEVFFPAVCRRKQQGKKISGAQGSHVLETFKIQGWGRLRERDLTYSFLSRIRKNIECFHMTSRRPYWCPKTMKRRPCWCPKPVLWELNSFLMQTLSFVPVSLHRCWPREWKHSIHPRKATLSFFSPETLTRLFLLKEVKPSAEREVIKPQTFDKIVSAKTRVF